MMNGSFPLALSLMLAASAARAQTPPNVVVIMVDDMGYSDIGAYGGEIETTNLDALAAGGVRYTRFYNTGRCTPSRASLLTGRYSHDVGVGHLNSDRGLPGYRGQIEASAQTLPEALGGAGYQTCMVGKWHLSRDLNNPNGAWPHQRGFDQFHGSLEGAKNYFTPSFFYDLTAGGAVTQITSFPPGYFYTDDVSTAAADFITNADPTDPVFVYVAFYAPHFPLQAPQAKTDEYLLAGTYANGWDPIRQARLDAQILMGMAQPGAVLSQRHGSVPNWSTLSQSKRDEMELRMSVYAAQVELMDIGVGRIVTALQNSGRFDDTLILFFSDNGAASGGGYDGTGPASSVGTAAAPVDTRYGNAWANVSNSPHRLFKSRNHEGGIATPLIAHWPNGIDAALQGSIDTTSRGHIIDVLPTALDVAGVTPAAAVEGISLTPTFSPTQTLDDSRLMFWEHEGRRGVSDGTYKIVAEGPSNAWELYQIQIDRNEENNLAGDPTLQPLLLSLIFAWEDWATRTNVIPWPWSPQYVKISPDPPSTACTLLAHYKFDAASYTDGSTVLDSSPNGFHATVDTRGDTSEHASPSSFPGLGNAFYFVDDIVDVNLINDIPTGIQPRAIACWFNSDTASTSNRVWGYGGSGNGGAFIMTLEGSTSNASLALRVSGSVVTYTPAAGSLSTGQWIHAVCVVPDGANNILDVDIFINGQLANKALTTGSNQVLSTGASFFGVGMRGGSSAGGTQTSFDFLGRVADIQVYRQALTLADAAFLFANPGQSLLRCATNVEFGSGCNGVGINADSRPHIGFDWSLSMSAPASVLLGGICLGFTDPDASLTPLGAPGCRVHTDLQVIEPRLAPFASPAVSVAIPFDPSLMGTPLFAQSFAFDATANPLGISTSEGVEATIGL